MYLQKDKASILLSMPEGNQMVSTLNRMRFKMLKGDLKKQSDPLAHLLPSF